MTRQEFAEMAEQMGLPMIEFDEDDFEEFVDLEEKEDRIIFSNNVEAFFRDVKSVFSEYYSNNPSNVSLLEINVSPHHSITINQFFPENGILNEVPFQQNLDEDESGNIQIIEKPRVIVLKNFENLRETVQRSLLLDSVDAYPIGNKEEFKRLGFIRTKQDKLNILVNASGERQGIPSNITQRCGAYCVYSEER